MWRNQLLEKQKAALEQAPQPQPQPVKAISGPQAAGDDRPSEDRGQPDAGALCSLLAAEIEVHDF